MEQNHKKWLPLGSKVVVKPVPAKPIVNSFGLELNSSDIKDVRYREMEVILLSDYVTENHPGLKIGDVIVVDEVRLGSVVLEGEKLQVINYQDIALIPIEK